MLANQNQGELLKLARFRFLFSILNNLYIVLRLFDSFRKFRVSCILLLTQLIGNRTEWSTIQGVKELHVNVL